MNRNNMRRSWWFALPAVLCVCAVVLMLGRGPALAQWDDGEQSDAPRPDRQQVARDHDEDHDDEAWDEDRRHDEEAWDEAHRDEAEEDYEAGEGDAEDEEDFEREIDREMIEVERELAHHELFITQIDGFRTMLKLIDDVSAICKDGEKAAILAVMTAEEVFETPRELAEFLEGMVDESQSEAVRRAIRVKLAEIYGDHGHTDRARQQLKRLITGKP